MLDKKAYDTLMETFPNWGPGRKSGSYYCPVHGVLTGQGQYSLDVVDGVYYCHLCIMELPPIVITPTLTSYRVEV